MSNKSFSSEQTPRNKTMAETVKSLLCIFMAVLLATCMTPFTPQAEADNQPWVNVFMTMPDGRTADVTKVVMTLNGADYASVKFEIKSSAHTSGNANSLMYDLVDVDSGNNDKLLLRSSKPKLEIPFSKLISTNNLQVRIMEVRDSNSEGVIVARAKLNIRIADSKKAEAQLPKGGWSFSNGLNITLGGSAPGGFFKDTKIVISAISLPVTYKHNPDGTTVVGINCNANDLAFYKAVKNRNVWQKYSDKALENMAKGISKGMSGKGVGSWGGKGLDWSIAGFAEFNTKNPTAPWNVTLVGTLGMKFSQSAQYFCLTGTVTAGVGGKFLGSIVRNPANDSYSGYIDLGGYGTLELFGGLGAGTIAAVGVYGRGKLEADFGLLPKSNFGLKTISVSGDAGLKAVAFNFDIVRWVVLEPKNSPYYLYKRDKKLPTVDESSMADASQSQGGTSTQATTLADVDADAVYPEISRNYLNEDSTWTGGDFVAGSSDALSTQATTLVQNIYGAADLVCTETKSGPVVAYIADAEQVGVTGRDSANRTVLVYSRYKDGKWTKPKPIDVTSNGYGATSDYNPSICALPDSDAFCVAWLDATKPATSGMSLGDIAKILDVRLAKVDENDNISIANVQFSDLYDGKAVSGEPYVYVEKGKAGNPIAYVAWATNEPSGSDGQVVGVSGKHDIYLAASDVTSGAGSYSGAGHVASEPGAITSMAVGNFKGTPTVAWSVDTTYAQRFKKAGESWQTVPMSDLTSLSDSGIYTMTQASWSVAPNNGAKSEKLVHGAGNVQFVTVNGAPVLAYTMWARADEKGNFASIYNANDGSLLLDGRTVELPTPDVRVFGDIGSTANKGMITCLRTNNAAGIAAMVKKGSAATDWGSIVDATDAKTDVTSYDIVYHNGSPMLVYTTVASASKNLATQSADSLSTQADDSDYVADLEVASGDALRDVNIEGVYFDEMEVDAGQVMPVSVEFCNDGVVPIDGVDIYTYNANVDNEPVLRVSTNEMIQSGDEGSATFEMQLPDSEAFTEDLQYYLLVVPKGATGVNVQAMTEQGDSTLDFTLGDPHLALETEHRLIDGQESVLATITNEGMVTSKPATLVFEHSESGIDLQRVEVPALAENETFTFEYNASNGYFQNTGVENITITLDDPNDPDDAYSLYNTDSIFTWEINDESVPTTKAVSAPKTSDEFPLAAVLLALLALAIFTSPFVVRKVNEVREGRSHETTS